MAILCQIIKEDNWKWTQPVLIKQDTPTTSTQAIKTNNLELNPQQVIIFDIPKVTTTTNISKDTAMSPPFASQVPLAEWSDDRFQDGCEEVASLMAVYWAQDKNLTPKKARE